MLDTGSRQSAIGNQQLAAVNQKWVYIRQIGIMQSP